MKLNVAHARQLIKAFDFKKLFINELGWDRHHAHLDVTVDGQPFTLAAIAQKHGMVAFTCAPTSVDPDTPSSCKHIGAGDIPAYRTRRRIETQVARTVHEHIIIYIDAAKTRQIWQWVKREAGRPNACREHLFSSGQTGDALIQKLEGIAFSLDEEEGLSIFGVASRVRGAFDVERVTKRFYDRFKTEHAAFLGFLKGIPDAEMQRWYVSVMINRLMFIYFIQKKGFLDGDTGYLRNKLAESKGRGKDRFYRDFLCPLFFEGFAKRENERSAAANQLLGEVPYLNGGLFLRHQIEEAHGKQIKIGDAAFERIFDFFDQYQWHLDERPLRADNEINPDVLGYIFEKYINQKQMGAYYTKEDITEYIGKNTIIPFLFDAARRKCRIAFEGDSSVWQLLQADPDRYIYPAVKKGVELQLPAEIAAGLGEVAKRTEWNKPAPEEYALPTETWREVVERRKRYEEVKGKLAAGEVRAIDDLITYNLDIRQFAQDVIENCEGPELLRAFWQAIERVTVLDPTCGSGAFLFAALNILEPLYEACLDRMQAFLDDLESSGAKHSPGKFGDFRKVLERVEEHPNRRYFILKSIILNNLYGVDIMEEATEICKLRLFLKLVAQVEHVDQVEPLPDIDFNVRAGNTLVGFASKEAVKKAITMGKDGQAKLVSAEDTETMARIEEKAEVAERAFLKFREMQTEHGMDAREFADAKHELRTRLKRLEDELNRYLAAEYGVDWRKKTVYEKWLNSHQPFHWFVEFHAIMSSGGFDVVIGNPPYVEYKDILSMYNVRNLATLSCSNLFAFVLERCYTLAVSQGRVGIILPLSAFSTDRMIPD
nr:hypothetical protein [Dehalococcoidales bacterium]